MNEEITWQDYVRSEVNALLDLYLPVSSSGNVGIRYDYPVKKRYEGKVVYDKSKAKGVVLSLVFDFNETIEVERG